MALGYQGQVGHALRECFGPEKTGNKDIRRQRFIEESLELAQASGGTADECHALVDYVFGRAAGRIPQEVGGVMLTLAGLCLAHGCHMDVCGIVELDRFKQNIEKIRQKEADKPALSALPVASALMEMLTRMGYSPPFLASDDGSEASVYDGDGREVCAIDSVGMQLDDKEAVELAAEIARMLNLACGTIPTKMETMDDGQGEKAGDG